MNKKNSKKRGDLAFFCDVAWVGCCQIFVG